MASYYVFFLHDLRLNPALYLSDQAPHLQNPCLSPLHSDDASRYSAEDIYDVVAEYKRLLVLLGDRVFNPSSFNFRLYVGSFGLCKWAL